MIINIIMHLSLAFPGVDPRDTHGEPPGTRGEWYIFDNFLGARGGDMFGFGNERFRLQGCTPGFGRHWSAVHGFQNPG